MCGIAGIFDHRLGQSHRPELEKMLGALTHRGPDASGLISLPGGGLVHTRLAVIDRTYAANQPFAWGGGRYHLVYNGELYNYRELRRELADGGVTFSTSSDTEVVAAALAEWGTEALPRFNGMFAFAWHDAADNGVLLARDRLGIKPLFYTLQHGCLGFASELEALAVAGFTNQGMDRDALSAYLALQYIPAPRTIYNGVQKLRPGQWLRVSPEGNEEGRYWSLAYAPDPLWTLDTAAEHYRVLLDDAIKLHSVADVPLGAFLSGGLDSSSVVAVMAEQSSAPIETFSIGFEEHSANELPFARAVATAFQTNHHECIARPDLASLLPEIVQRFGEPFADSSALPTWLVSKMAREHVTVALSGDGGDELFAGYTWLHRTLLNQHAAKIPNSVRQALTALLRLAPQSPHAEQARRFLTDAGLPAEALFRRRLSLFDPEIRRTLLGAESAWDPYAEAWNSFSHNDDTERMLGVDTLLYLPDDILAKVDRMSMAHALEVRVPLLDHRIVEFAATVPFPLKHAWGESKRFARHAFRDTLPPEVLRPRKRGFALPIHDWFRGALGNLYQERVLAPDARIREVLDVTPLQRLYTEHQQGQENHGHRLWSMLVLEEFLCGMS